ncbi:MAG TPA: phospholipase D-like domain-containing protein [Pyrinomonadaceae bacterium]|nr:phospholipase D-like domain-containing protein [Pyrinomonadaceae bacterium]
MTTELQQEERAEEVETTGGWPVRRVLERAHTRATGSPLIRGNGVRLLKDAAENYPAWLEAIKGARRTIHFESFIIHEDDVGREFAAALCAKAKEGVRVRVVYDWLGAVGKTSRRFWRNLRDAGVEVKGFNPPRYDEPFGWLNRDHRKMISVDGTLGYVMGLCVGQDWLGRPEKNIEPWRDTGVEIRGPAVAEMDAAFASVWQRACGERIPKEDLPERDSIEPQGEVPVRVIATEPNTVGLYRLEQLVAAGAREYLWLTDAYFVGTTMYVQALRAAAQDGVDVRLLVPSASDIPVVSALSRANYRALLEAGVRVFEWNGPMIHAKTSVVDGKWARVGSTNLNVASWMGNWELDVTVEDEAFAKQMEEMYCRDLENATEIVISERRRVRPIGPPRPRRRQRTSRKGSTSRAAAGAIGIGSAVGAAITNRRELGPAEARIMAMAAGLLLALSIVAVKWPRGVTYPLAFVGTWVSLALFIRAYKLKKGPGGLKVPVKSEPASPPAPAREER